MEWVDILAFSLSGLAFVYAMYILFWLKIDQSKGKEVMDLGNFLEGVLIGFLSTVFMGLVMVKLVQWGLDKHDE